MVIFPYNANNYWYLGLPFIQKYQFVFNHDSKTIGFYVDLEEDPINESDGFEFKYLRLVIEILSAIILAIVVFFVAKKIYEQRKKRANELTDDNFDYMPKNDEEEQSGNNAAIGIN